MPATERQYWTGGGQSRYRCCPTNQGICCAVIGRCRIAGLILALAALLSPGWAEESAVARLAEALATAEARDGKTSPYLLPVIEELAQAQLRDGSLGEAAGLRR